MNVSKHRHFLGFECNTRVEKRQANVEHMLLACLGPFCCHFCWQTPNFMNIINLASPKTVQKAPTEGTAAAQPKHLLFCCCCCYCCSGCTHTTHLGCFIVIAPLYAICEPLLLPLLLQLPSLPPLFHRCTTLHRASQPAPNNDKSQPSLFTFYVVTEIKLYFASTSNVQINLFSRRRCCVLYVLNIIGAAQRTARATNKC